jgi:translation elongation factor EF-4
MPDAVLISAKTGQGVCPTLAIVSACLARGGPDNRPQALIFDSGLIPTATDVPTRVFEGTIARDKNCPNGRVLEVETPGVLTPSRWKGRVANTVSFLMANSKTVADTKIATPY